MALNIKKMRIITTEKVKEMVERLAIKANTVIRPDIMLKLNEALRRETNFLAKTALGQIIENSRIAGKEKLALCQDTGLPVIFVELGQEVFLKGSNFSDAVNDGIEAAYKKSGFRKSVIQDPFRKEKDIRFIPAIIYVDIKPGDKIRLTVAPKGFGSENVSRIKMFRPTAEEKEIIGFVVETALAAGPSACPPFIIGVGIGGTLDKAVLLSKKALCLNITRSNSSPRIAGLEKIILREINKSKLGAMGFGGKTTVLGVNILTHPTHIAGLPVSVSVGCHATRSACSTI